MDFYTGLKEEFRQKVEERGLLAENVQVKGHVLSTEEAIGTPEREDYPLLQGKEYMVEASLNGYRGQAFTDDPGDFSGSIEDILDLPLDSTKNRAVFIATLNAVMRLLGSSERTIHCKNETLEKCANKLADYIYDKFGDVKIALVGLQPAMLDQLRHRFKIRVLDLDPDNIGKEKYSITIEHGQRDFEEVINWADILLVTGSTVVNGSIVNFLNFDKPVLFYGNTIAGAAVLMNLERVCFYAE